MAHSDISRRELIKRGGIAALWVTPAVQIIGIDRAQAQETSPLPGPTGTCSGIVFWNGDPYTGDARVLLRTESVEVDSTTTGPDGEFTFPPVPVGTYFLHVFASENGSTLTGSANCEVVAGEDDFHNIDLQNDGRR